MQRDQHGNEWHRLHLPDVLADERCVEPGCPSRSRMGSHQCFEHHRGKPVWCERHEIWLPPVRQLRWCSEIKTRKIVWL